MGNPWRSLFRKLLVFELSLNKDKSSSKQKTDEIFVTVTN